MSPHRTRSEIMSGVRRLVIKVGSSIITEVGSEGPRLAEGKIRALAGSVQRLPERVRDVIIVSSGAIAAGRGKASLPRPATVPEKQALAALGQSRLMWAYETVFREYGRNVAQVLLTLDDVHSRGRFVNARNTLDTLLGWGVIPVVNENDTVVVEEIKFGDNDTLSALVTSLADADLLVILSDVAGLYDGDPRREPGAHLIHSVQRVDAALLALAGGSGSAVGTGGMTTKLTAAAKVMDLGVPVVIADGHAAGTVERILAGEEVGTLFVPRRQRMAKRKHWIRHTLRPRGTLTVDAGAVRAVLSGGKSLLAAGIVAVEGSFKSGDAVRCVDHEGREFARGLAGYSAREIGLIRGRHTDAIEAVLGYKYQDEVIHRDNLVLVERGESPGGKA